MQAITGQLHEVTSASISNKTVLKATFDSAINNWQHLLLSAKGNLMQLEQYLATSRELRQYQRQPDKLAVQQKVQGVSTPVTSGQSENVPPGTDVELTGVLKVLKTIDNALA